MRISQPFDPRARQGYALLMTLVFLAVTLIMLSSVMWWASSNGKVTRQNQLFTTAESAADAATETVVANLDFDWTYNQTLQSASHYSTLPLPNQSAWPMQFQYSDGSGNNGVTGVTIALTNYYAAVGSEFQGLSGYKQPCSITSTATTIGQTYTVSATVQQTVEAVIIPLFQFAIFYNMNLEIDPGATMAINGPVFSNQGIWDGTPNLTFNSTVSAAGLVYDQSTDTTNDDPWASGKGDPGTPSGNYAIQPLSGRDSLTLPIGNSSNNTPSSVEAVINLVTNGYGAPNPQAYSTNGQVYLFNESDLIISNAASGLVGPRSDTNITVWFQDPNNSASYLTKLNPDVTNYPSAGVTNKFFSFITNVSYYDYRESDTVQAVQVDVGKLNTWLNAGGGGNWVNRTSNTDNHHGIQSIYIYNNVQPNPSQLPAVRLVNGAQMPYTTDPNGINPPTGGLTVTTPQPLYVKGSYNVQTASSSAGASSGTTNTANTYPAAIIGDAITILSANWSDTYTSGTSIGSRNLPSATTINAACLEGIVQSTNSNYSGGVENFLRLEENWTGVTLTYNGSIAVMFPSQYATSFWPGTGSVYNPPVRNWGFDYNFTNPNKLPHPSPKVFRIVRDTWKDY
jgi:hypothetical protein